MQQVSARRYRTLIATEVVRGATFRFLVGVPLDSTEAMLRRTRAMFFWMAPAVLLIAALSGYWISLRALAPVDEITRAAQTIGIQNLSERLNVLPRATNWRGCPKPGTRCSRGLRLPSNG